ncbi:MAG: hypothetical protein ACRES1_03260, partial [Steroidobacteraceae bacterium]
AYVAVHSGAQAAFLVAFHRMSGHGDDRNVAAGFPFPGANTSDWAGKMRVLDTRIPTSGGSPIW